MEVVGAVCVETCRPRRTGLHMCIAYMRYSVCSGVRMQYCSAVRTRLRHVMTGTMTKLCAGSGKL